MMLIRAIRSLFTGGVGETVKEVASVFGENKEAGALRGHEFKMGALDQFSAEFHGKGPLNQFVDFVNRLPRPAMALGVIYLFYSAMYQPVLFAEAMAGLALVPEPLWWILGAIVSFYFGARELSKSRQFKVAKTASGVRTVVENVKQIRSLRPESPSVAADDDPATHMAIVDGSTGNAAVDT